MFTNIKGLDPESLLPAQVGQLPRPMALLPIPPQWVTDRLPIT